MVAGSPVSIQSPARNRPAHRRGVAGRDRLAGRERKRRARLAHHRRADERGLANRRQCIEQLVMRERQSVRRSSSPRAATAPLDTSDRCDASPPNTARLSNTHCIDRPGSPTNEPDVGQHIAIEPEVHGDDGRRGHQCGALPSHPRAASVAGDELSQSKPRHGRYRSRRHAIAHRRPRLQSAPSPRT